MFSNHTVEIREIFAVALQPAGNCETIRRRILCQIEAAFIGIVFKL